MTDPLADPLADPLVEPLKRLDRVLDSLGPAAVAVSGGVDSMTLAARAHARLGEAVRMYHATSPAVPEAATARVRSLADRLGWDLVVFDAGEFDDPAYRANPVNRCFYCKTGLYGAMRRRTDALLLSGTNADDLGDYRPGLAAADNHNVRHPYVEAGIDKAAVRAIAYTLGHDDLAALPAQPCLSSRVETGIAIQSDVLAVIDAAERFVVGHLAPNVVRCRVRRAEICIELDAATLERLDADTRTRVGADIIALFSGTGLDHAVTFAPYRMGSAFVGAATAS